MNLHYPYNLNDDCGKRNQAADPKHPQNRIGSVDAKPASRLSCPHIYVNPKSQYPAAHREYASDVLELQDIRFIDAHKDAMGEDYYYSNDSGNVARAKCAEKSPDHQSLEDMKGEIEGVEAGALEEYLELTEVIILPGFKKYQSNGQATEVESNSSNAHVEHNPSTIKVFDHHSSTKGDLKQQENQEREKELAKDGFAVALDALQCIAAQIEFRHYQEQKGNSQEQNGYPKHNIDVFDELLVHSHELEGLRETLRVGVCDFHVVTVSVNQAPHRVKKRVRELGENESKVSELQSADKFQGNHLSSNKPQSKYGKPCYCNSFNKLVDHLNLRIHLRRICVYREIVCGLQKIGRLSLAHVAQYWTGLGEISRQSVGLVTHMEIERIAYLKSDDSILEREGHIRVGEAQANDRRVVEAIHERRRSIRSYDEGDAVAVETLCDGNQRYFNRVLVLAHRGSGPRSVVAMEAPFYFTLTGASVEVLQIVIIAIFSITVQSVATHHRTVPS